MHSYEYLEDENKNILIYIFPATSIIGFLIFGLIFDYYKFKPLIKAISFIEILMPLMMIFCKVNIFSYYITDSSHEKRSEEKKRGRKSVLSSCRQSVDSLKRQKRTFEISSLLAWIEHRKGTPVPSIPLVKDTFLHFNRSCQQNGR